MNQKMFLPLISLAPKIQTYKRSLTKVHSCFITTYTQRQEKESQVPGAMKSENLVSGGRELMGKAGPKRAEYYRNILSSTITYAL